MTTLSFDINHYEFLWCNFLFKFFIKKTHFFLFDFPLVFTSNLSNELKLLSLLLLQTSNKTKKNGKRKETRRTINKNELMIILLKCYRKWFEMLFK